MRAFNQCNGFIWNMVDLAMHFMISDIVYLNGLERPCADMQRNISDLNALLF